MAVHPFLGANGGGPPSASPIRRFSLSWKSRGTKSGEAKMETRVVKEKHETHLLTLANVVGVGIGARDGKEVVKVFVSRKVPESSLRASDVIPRILDGCDVDVEEIGMVTAQPE
jgi:hypothetical protein